MIDINTILTQALTAVVQEATKPLLARIEALETKPAEAQTTSVVIDKAQVVEALDNQEWFWEKIRNFTDAAAERAIEEHTDLYDHDDYDSHISDDDKHFDGDLEQTIRDTVCGMTFEIR